MAHVDSLIAPLHWDAYRRQIDEALEECLRLPHGCPAPLAEALRYSLLAPGKRFRPLLVILAAYACRGQFRQSMPAACAVEMVHTYSLIHDDLPAMDDDDLRRGRPTCHRAFGEAVAILAGDALLALAFETIAKGIEPPQVAAACCAALAEAAGPCHLVGGQADDIDPAKLPQTLATLESIHARKTGAMISVSLRLGGLASEATSVELDALARFGRCLGVAFQITDDLLDVCGTEASMGKRVGKDASLGKLTFPGLLGIEASRQRAEQLVAEATAAISIFAERGAGLAQLAAYVLERNH